ncbi:4-hydroxythreonine-4-phosphate dehydrogenase [Salinarchaeum sp. Harcht-Bsk1]|nr:4-hydroxythreonine-4-phosphate dehydrogenase [Salinarchaeum sp. Harcht-Bsk1]
MGVTMGDPAGIGAEIVVEGHDEIAALADVVVIGDASVLRAAVECCDSSLSVEAVDDVAEASFADDAVSVLDLDLVDDLEYGVIREEYGAASLAYVEKAIELAKAGTIDAITTAPIHKQATRMAGSEHAGHTGLLAARTDTDVYSMMLVHDDLRVSHVSTHVPLREACDLVTTEAVLDTIRVTDEGLRQLGVEEPIIAVAGLNPHASDGGLLGDEEAAEIEPAVERAREEGIDAVGPEPPDTVYPQAAGGAADCVVSMYHDQGHIPIKMLGFGDGAVTGVNVTIGLPIVRTSVDHGTAFDIAGTCQADPTSLIDAVEVAVRAAR